MMGGQRSRRISDGACNSRSKLDGDRYQADWVINRNEVTLEYVDFLLYRYDGLALAHCWRNNEEQ